jgi:hypothetical protein
MKIIAIAAALTLVVVGGAEARGGSHSFGSHVSSNRSSSSHASGLYVPRGPDHTVRSYVRKDGTYVAPSHATNPDRTRNDNYSTRGNLNPYTLKAGTKPRDGE